MDMDVTGQSAEQKMNHRLQQWVRASKTYSGVGSLTKMFLYYSVPRLPHNLFQQGSNLDPVTENGLKPDYALETIVELLEREDAVDVFYLHVNHKHSMIEEPFSEVVPPPLKVTPDGLRLLGPLGDIGVSSEKDCIYVYYEDNKGNAAVMIQFYEGSGTDFRLLESVSATDLNVLNFEGVRLSGFFDKVAELRAKKSVAAATAADPGT